MSVTRPWPGNRSRPRFVVLCCAGGPGCLWPHGCSGRRRARPPARLGPHFVRRRASKPARALRSLRRPSHQWCLAAVCGSARHLEARPGPAAAHRHRSPVPRCSLRWRAYVCARKSSPCALKTPQIRRFYARWASYFAPTGAVTSSCRRCGALQAGGSGGVLHYTKPSRGVSLACRAPVSCNSPRLVAARPQFAVMWPPKCRHIGQKTLKTGCFG